MIINNKQAPMAIYVSIFGVLLLHISIIKLLFMQYKPITNTYSTKNIEVTFLTSDQVLEASNTPPTTQPSSLLDDEVSGVPVIEQQKNNSDTKEVQVENNSETKPITEQYKKPQVQAKNQSKQKNDKAVEKKLSQKQKDKTIDKEKDNNKGKDKKQVKDKAVAQKKDIKDQQVTDKKKSDIKDSVKKDIVKKDIATKTQPQDDDIAIETLSESELENLTIAGEIGRSVATDNQGDSEYEIVETIGDRQELAEEIAREQQAIQQQTKQQQTKQQFDQQANNNIKVEFSLHEVRWAKRYATKLPLNILDNIIDEDVFEVKIKLEIDKQGKIISATKVKTSGRADIDNFALRDIKNARFKPFIRNNVPVAGILTLPIKYEVH